MSYTAQQFLDTLKPYALNDMNQSTILASLTAAQGFIESNKGNSGLTQKCNNLFGIKGKYQGQGELFWTTEYYNGVKTRVQAYFRKYPSWQESVNDHSGLFNRLDRYKNLRGETDYVRACNNVHLDGYATSPTYATTLIETINKFKLYEWDREVLNKIIDVKPAKEPGEYYPLLKVGSKGDYVLRWQIFLNSNGFFVGKEDGKFGKNTKLGVMEFQDYHGLKADGIIGEKTWNAAHDIANKNMSLLYKIA